MKVLFLDQYGDPGGAQHCLLDLLPAMRERGWQTYVAAPDDGPLLKLACGAGAIVDTLRCGPYRSGGKTASDMARFALELPRLAGEISGLIKRYEPEILYVNGPRLLPAVSIGAPRRLPVVFHCHSLLRGGPIVWLAGSSLRLLGATLIANCDFVTGPLAGYVRDGYIVYNGVDGPAKLVPKSKPSKHAGMVGRIAPEKGQAQFVDAARIASPDLPGWRFVICGAPLFQNADAQRYDAALRERAEGLPVEFLGWSCDPPAVLAGLDLLVVPSLAVEATTRVIVEAFAMGTPVLATRCGGIPEIVEDGSTGFLVDSPDPAALACRMCELLHGPPERLQEVSRRARRAWEQRFTLRHYQNRILEILSTLV
ncbi:MAG: glycosyltransferase family 4 protein [Bryobacteraceae bacterium]